MSNVVAWRYRRLGRPKWNVTNNPELIAGLAAKGSHTVEELVVEDKPCTLETHDWIDFGGKHQQMCTKCGVGRSTREFPS